MSECCRNVMLTADACDRRGTVFDEEAGGVLCAEHATEASRRREETGSAVMADLTRTCDPGIIDREHSTWLPPDDDDRPRPVRYGISRPRR